MLTDECYAESSNQNAREAGARLQELLLEARRGSQTAMKLLFERYRHPVLRVIRTRFLPPDEVLRRRVDSADIEQLAWQAAFEAVKSGKAFPDEHAFLHFLLTLTKNFVKKAIRAHVTTQKRSIRRDVALAQEGRFIVDRMPDPGEVAAFTDEWQQFLKTSLPVDRCVLQQLALGWSVQDVAGKLGLPTYAVQRIRKMARLRWEDRQRRGGGRAGRMTGKCDSAQCACGGDP
jgi:DNA-directed RNA polymerase specialized sigma24 family protein